MDKITSEKMANIMKYYNLLKQAISGDVINYAAMLAEDIGCEARSLCRHLQDLKDTETGNE